MSTQILAVALISTDFPYEVTQPNQWMRMRNYKEIKVINIETESMQLRYTMSLVRETRKFNVFYCDIHCVVCFAKDSVLGKTKTEIRDECLLVEFPPGDEHLACLLIFQRPIFPCNLSCT